MDKSKFEQQQVENLISSFEAQKLLVGEQAELEQQNSLMYDANLETAEWEQTQLHAEIEAVSRQVIGKAALRAVAEQQYKLQLEARDSLPQIHVALIHDMRAEELEASGDLLSAIEHKQSAETIRNNHSILEIKTHLSDIDQQIAFKETEILAKKEAYLREVEVDYNSIIALKQEAAKLAAEIGYLSASNADSMVELIEGIIKELAD